MQYPAHTGNVHVIVGGQFGSEAKGAVTAWLARQILRRGHRASIIRVAGPNAGHTAYDDEGTAYALRQVPVAMVVDDSVKGYIAAGSEIDLPVVLSEVELLEAHGHNPRRRLTIDPAATLLTQEHHQRETDLKIHQRLGSTGKGIGAARSDRIMRTAHTYRELIGASDQQLDQLLAQYWPDAEVESLHRLVRDLRTADVATQVLADLGEEGREVLIEGTQGYGLGLHGAHYPKCTSSDTRAIDFLAMAGINPWAPQVHEVHVWVALRVHPIRVAGDSGALKDETTWEELGLPTELTTVTHLPRRVGGWDRDLARQALAANGAPSPNVHACITMGDQEYPQLAGMHGTFDRVNVEIARAVLPVLLKYLVELDVPGIAYVGTGPKTQVWADQILDQVVTDTTDQVLEQEI